jgi:hypothetical protein
MNCTRCHGTGYLNTEQIPEGTAGDLSVEAIRLWILEQSEPHDVAVCDCCGDGDSHWHGEPGGHYIGGDMIGSAGPYAYNGGLCECH